MAKAPSLADVLSDLRTKQKLPIGTLNEFEMVPFGLSTGNITLDTLTGVGGYPAGRIVEQFGKPSSGKTTAALQAAGICQANGGNVVFLDYERSLDESYCKALGVDTDALIYMQPNSFEQGANAFRQMLKTGEVQMLIVDSVATMVTENELSADTGAAKVADRAKMMHQFLRQIVGEVHRTNCSAIFLNHVMDVVDASPMGQKLAARGIKRQTTPGGMALPFYASLRIEFKQVGNIRTAEESLLSGQKEDQITQTKVQATIVKNKVGDPFGTAELRVRWGKGFSQPYSIYRILSDYAVIKKSGAKYTFPPGLQFSTEEKKAFPVPTPQRGDDWIVGEENVLKAMESSPKWMAELEKTAAKIIAERGHAKVDGSDYDSNGLSKDESEAIKELDVLESENLSVDEATGELL